MNTRSKPNKWVVMATRKKDNLADEISDLCNMRMEDMAVEFARRFPKRNLLIMFGMGDSAIEVDGHYLPDGRWHGRKPKCLAFIEEAIKDVEIMSECHTIGRPNNVTINGTKKGKP